MSKHHGTATRKQLESFIGRRVSALTAGLHAGAGPAQAELAALRTAAGGDPAAQPRLWATVLDGLEDADAPDLVTWAEAAAFHALTLFAVHQQSRPEPMHRAGRGMGDAVRVLQQRRPDAGSLRRRFAGAASADDPAELARLLRPLVQQLRAEAIPLDYARLAGELMQFHTPAGRVAVRQRWGRQLSRTASQDQPRPTTDPTNSNEKEPS